MDWGAAGTRTWIAVLLAVALVGVGLTRAARVRRRRRAPGRASPAAGRLPDAHGAAAALIGVAFAAAGLAGFLPPLTPPPPPGAPPLTLDAGYGYLLGLFPVNVLHSLFHLAVGIAGLLACRRAAVARRFVRGFAIALAGLTIAGALPASHTLLGLAPLFGHDVWLHGAEALAAGVVGFAVAGGAGAPRRRRATGPARPAGGPPPAAATRPGGAVLPAGSPDTAAG
jgi:hypothetical protein